MTYIEYEKAFLNDVKLIEFLKSKLLKFRDEDFAKKTLKNITYYRLKSYSIPFMNQNNTFENTYFEDIENLYRFDEELRHILFGVIGKIEIKLRSKINYTVTNFTNNPFWYLDESLFINRYQHKNILNKISNTFLGSSENYVKHFKRKYINSKNNTYKYLPPFWIVSEIVMFGEILNIYKSLNKVKFNKDNLNLLDELAKEFGAYNLKELNSWITFIKLMRNRTAHHSRVWNMNYFAPARIYSRSSNHNRLTIQPSNANRLYSFLAILNIISKNLKLNISIKKIIENLMIRYPVFDEMKISAGFPDNWSEDSFWNL